jgi:hypothetical protein
MAAESYCVEGRMLGFRMKLGKVGADIKGEYITEADMACLSCATNGGTTTLVWKGHPRLGDGFMATATIERKDGLWEYSFRYDGCEVHDRVVESVTFPEFISPRTDETRYLFPAPLGPGRINRPDWPKLKPGEGTLSSRCGFPGFQFIAVFTPGERSFYLDARGTEFRPRIFTFANGERPGTIRFGIEWLRELSGGEGAWMLPARGTFRCFDGGWFEAVEIYRPWARRQRWFAEAAGRRPPERLRDVALWLWLRGLSADILPVVERVKRDAGVPVALDWYWWHAIPYDSGYPNFWPPREGADAFAAAIRGLEGRGVMTQVYTNGHGWDMDDPSWRDGGEADMKKKIDGTWTAIAFNRYDRHRLSYVCGEAPHFQRRFAAVAAHLRASGLSALYMDQIAASGQGVCYNPAHSHAPGGSDGVVEGFRGFAGRLRRALPGMLFSTEEYSEAYMGAYDFFVSCYSCYERCGWGVSPQTEAVPVFQALYHDVMPVAGSYALMDGVPPWDPLWPDKDRWRKEEDWKAKFPDQFALEFARCVVWGLQPTVHQLRIANCDDPRLAADYRFLINTVRFYHANRDLLFDGEMLSPGRLKCDTKAVDFLIRGIYTKEGEYRTVRQDAMPSVLHTVWRSKDGRTAAVLVNWTDEPRAWKLEGAEVSGSGAIPPRSWCRVCRQPATIR